MPALDMIIQMRSVWLAIIVCFGLASPTYATTIFQESYEVEDVTTLSTTGWTVTNNNGTIGIVKMPGLSESKSLRMEYGEQWVNDCCNGKIARSWAGVDEIYERFYLRMDTIDLAQPSSFTGGAATSMKLHFFNPGGVEPFAVLVGFFSGSQALGMTVNYPINFLVTCPSGKVQSTCSYPPNIVHVPFPKNVDRYVCVETHAKVGAPNVNDGILEIWQDGLLTLRYPNLKFLDTASANGKFSRVEVYRQGGNNLYRYEDNYVLATTRIGCLPSTSSSDSTPPASPIMKILTHP